MLALKKTEDRFTASISQPQAVTMWEKPTLPLTEPLVRDGRTHRMVIVSPTWEITTSVGIRLEQDPNPRSGVIPLILNVNARTVQFHSVPL